MDVQPGLIIAKAVRLQRLLSKGGMGSVWVADHLALGTQVAVKFMSPELMANPEAVERFKREAKAAARIKSPYVVQTFDYGAPAGGIPYIVMELLEGEDLATRVSRHGPLSISDTEKVVVHGAKALAKAHKLGIFHRDIKPDNIFITESDGDIFAKVLDFGIAKESGKPEPSVTCTGTTMGTPSYMSPEQMLSAKDVDFRCDLWALGAVAYFCLTGQQPFAGETFGSICVAINEGQFPLPSSFRERVPQPLDDWFVRALCRDITQRFRSAKEMADAFCAAIDDSAYKVSQPRGFSDAISSSHLPSPRQPTLSGASLTYYDTARRSRARFTAVLMLTVISIASVYLFGNHSLAMTYHQVNVMTESVKRWMYPDSHSGAHPSPSFSPVQPNASSPTDSVSLSSAGQSGAAVSRAVPVAELLLKAPPLRSASAAVSRPNVHLRESKTVLPNEVFEAGGGGLKEPTESDAKSKDGGGDTQGGGGASSVGSESVGPGSAVEQALRDASGANSSPSEE